MRKTNFWWWNLGRGRHCRLVQLLGRLSQTDQSQDRLAGTFAPFVKAVPVLSIIRMFAFVTRFATLTNGMGNVLWANAWGNETKGKCVRKKKTGGKKKHQYSHTGCAHVHFFALITLQHQIHSLSSTTSLSFFVLVDLNVARPDRRPEGDRNTRTNARIIAQSRTEFVNLDAIKSDRLVGGIVGVKARLLL